VRSCRHQPGGSCYGHQPVQPNRHRTAGQRKDPNDRQPISVTLDKTAFVLAPSAAPASQTATAPINQTAPVATDATLAQHVPEPIFVRSSDLLDTLSLRKLVGERARPPSHRGQPT